MFENMKKCAGVLGWCVAIYLAVGAATACAASAHPEATDGVGTALGLLGGASDTHGGTAVALRILIGLSLLSVLPAILICVTSFLRIVTVMSILRQAIGLQETPPNMVIIGISLFLTLFTMAPVFERINVDAAQPFMAGKMSISDAMTRGMKPLHDFMIRQTREQDLALMVELAKARPPEQPDDVSNIQLVPAFMLSELRAAFQIGFVIFLPFVLIDLVVSSILMSLGMMMVPPASIALPIKILMFVLIDGWSLVIRAIVGSFH